MYSIIFLITLTGLAIGSFLNVVIYRLPLGRKVTGRSQCTTCEHMLTPVELVPIASWILQKGKCKNCGEKISGRYALVEFITAFAFFTFAYKYVPMQEWVLLGASLFAVVMLVPIAFIDFDTMFIPDRLQVGLLVSMILFANAMGVPVQKMIMDGLIIALPLFAIAWLTNGFGYADVKLMFTAGVAFGWYESLYVLTGAGVIAIVYALFNKIKQKQEFPFGPFIAIAFYMMLLLS